MMIADAGDRAARRPARRPKSNLDEEMEAC